MRFSEKGSKSSVFGRYTLKGALLAALFTTSYFLLSTSRLISAPWWDLRFTDGNNGTYDSSIEDMLESYILGASSMVYLANYSIPSVDTKITTSMNNRDTAGKDVKYVGDGTEGNYTGLQAGIPKVLDAAGTPIMHNKFLIIDPTESDRKLVTGSGNYTAGGWGNQDSAWLTVTDSVIINKYLAEFNEMFGGTFHNTGATTNPVTTANGITVHTLFSSEDGPWLVGKIVDTTIRAATESVFFETTGHDESNTGTLDIDEAIWSVLDDAGKPNFFAEGVVNNMGSTLDTAFSGTSLTNYNTKGGYIRKSAVAAWDKHHAKYVVVDMDWLGVGSVNASKSSSEYTGATGNDENHIFINDFRLVRAFMKEFARHYAIDATVGSVDNAGVTEIHDWTAPNAPTGLSVTPAANSFDVSWTAPADPGDFSRYYIFITTNNNIATAKNEITEADGSFRASILRPEMQRKGRTTTTATLTTYNEGDALAAATNYYIGVVSVDKFGNESAALTGGPYQLSGANNPPNNPASLQQYKSDGTTVIAVGAQTTETTVILKGTVSDPDVNNVKLQVEVRPTGTAFSNTFTHESALVASGNTASVTVSGLISGTTYHWQSRAVDSAAAASSWVVFNGADGNHFVVQTAATSNGTILPNAKGGTDNTTENLTEIQTDNAAGASPTSMAVGDGWYTVEGNTMFLDGFDVTGYNGTITALTLKVQYSVEAGYAGANSVRWALNGGGLTNTTITPVNGQVDTIATYNLFAQGVDTFPEISTLDIEFTNTDGNDGIAFDYLWLEVTYTPGANTTPTAPTGGTTTPDGSVNWINDNTPTFSWTFNDPDAGDSQSAYQLTTSGGYDTGKTASGTSSHTPGSALSDGNRTWNVKTWDAADAVSPTSSNWTVKIDATNPTTPASLDAGYNGTSSTLTWTASTDATSGLKTYNVYRATYAFTSTTNPNVSKLNGSDFTSTSYTDSTVVADQTYYYGITAVDNATNTSALSNIKSVYTGIPPSAGDDVTVLKISQVSAATTVAANEYVELYNPTASTITVHNGTNWLISLRTVSSANAVSYKTLTAVGSTPKTIKPKSFFLIASVNPIDGVVPDATYPAAFTSDSGVKIDSDTVDTSGDTVVPAIDKVSWSDVTPPAAGVEGTGVNVDMSTGKSIERKANATSTAATMLSPGADWNQGNGYDTDNNSNDFVIHTATFVVMQNSSSPMEPPAAAGDSAAPTNVGLVSPANNSVNVSTTSTLTVNTASDATPPISYYIQLALDSAFTSGVQFENWDNANTTWTPALANNTTYYWRVKARDSVATPNETTYKGHTLDVDGYGKFVTISSTTINNPPLAPSSLGGASVVSGLWLNDNTPSFEFTLDDPDNNNVKYRLVIDDSADFLSPVVDYTSALAAEGLRTFTVGQAAGGGSYTTGSAGQTLADSAGYYWQVKCIDEAGAESSYSAANGGAIAFKVDTNVAAPTALNAGYNGTNASTLTWTAGDATPSGLKTYNIYRATYAFTATTNPNVTKLNAVDVTVTNYTDYPAPGQTYYYGVTAVDNAANVSALSNIKSVVVSVTGHIVISEIQIDGATATDEFVELYNPTDSDIVMSGWRLRKKNSTGTEATLVATLSGTIPAHGFFLIGCRGYVGAVSTNTQYSTADNIPADGCVILYSDAGVTVVDKVGIGASVDFETAAYSTNPAANRSIERKANTDSSAATMASGGVDELEGNGYDTDNNLNDFVYRTTSDPQNSNSQREPAIANITLSNYDVNPDTAIVTQTFTYTVQYRNAVSGNVPPDTAQVFIDGTAYNLVYQGGAYDVLAIFQYSTTLSTGTHTYYFYFVKGPDSARAPETSPDVYNGPCVGPELEGLSAYNPPTANPADNTTVPVTASKTIYAYLATGSNNWSGYSATIYWSTSTAPGGAAINRSRTMTYAETNANGYDVFYVILSSAVDYKAGMYLNYYVRAGDAVINPKFTDDAGDTNSDGWVSTADANPNVVDSYHYFKIDTAGPGIGMFDVIIAKKTEPCITSDPEKFTNDFSWTPGWRTGTNVDDGGPNNLTYNNEDTAVNVSLSPSGAKANCTFYYTNDGSDPAVSGTRQQINGGAAQSNNNNWYKYDNATTGMSDIKAFFPSDLNAAGTTIWIYAIGHAGTGAGPYAQYFKYYVGATPGTPEGDKDDAIVSGRGIKDGRYPTTDFNNYSPLRHSQYETLATNSIIPALNTTRYLSPGTTDEFVLGSNFLTASGHDGMTDIFYSDQVQFYLRTSYRDISETETTWPAEAYIVWLATTTDWSVAPYARLKYNSTGDDNQSPHLLKYHWLVGENTGLEGYSTSNPSDCTKGAPEGSTVKYIFKMRDNQSTGDFKWIYRDPSTKKQRMDIINSGTTAKISGNQFEYKVLQDDITRPVAYMPQEIPGVVSITAGGVVTSTYTAPSWPTAPLGSTATTCGSTVETVKVYIGLFDTADGRFTYSNIGSTACNTNPNYVHRTFKDPNITNSNYFGNDVLAINTTNYTANSGIKGGKSTDSYAEGLEGYNSEGRRYTHDVLCYYVWRKPGSVSGGVTQPFSWINTDGTVNGSPSADATGTVPDSPANQMIRIAEVDGVANNSYVTQESSAATDGYISGRVSMAPYNVDPVTGNGIWVANIPAPSDNDIMVSTCVYLYYRIWACNGDNDPQAYYTEIHGGCNPIPTAAGTNYAGSHKNSIGWDDPIGLTNTGNPYGKEFIDSSDYCRCGRVHDRDYGWVDVTRYGGRVTSPRRVMIKSKVTVGGVTRTITTFMKVDPTTGRPTNIISTQVGAE